MAKKSLTAQLAEVRAENKKLMLENYDLRGEAQFRQRCYEALKEEIARLQFAAGRPSVLKAKKKPDKVVAMPKRK